MNLASERENRLSGLMKKAQEGDQVAYETLLMECAVLIREFAMRRLDKPEFAEEVVQEALISIHGARHTYDPSRPFTPWMFAIAQHRLSDFLRQSIRIAQHEEYDETKLMNYVFPQQDSNELSEEIAAAVLKLPEKQRQVVELLKVQNLSVREVAVKLNMSESSVKVTAHRAYKTLRRILGGR